jgi:hypothetical protein
MSSGDTILFDFDLASLENAIKRLIPHTKKTLPEIVNQRLLNIAGRAMNATARADKMHIQLTLGEIGRQLKTTKSGKIRRGNRIYASKIAVRGKEVPLAALIINSQRGANGKKGLYGREMAQAIQRKVAARQRSVGFDAIGYVPGIRALARASKKPFMIANFKGLAIRGEEKGNATIATDSLAPVAILINRVHSILKVDNGAMQSAIDEEAREINRHIEEDLTPVFQEFNRA